MATGSNGFLSKFQQRLRNIRIARNKQKKKNDEFIQEKVEEIHRVVGNNGGTYVKAIADVESNQKQKVEKSSSIQPSPQPSPVKSVDIVVDKGQDKERVADDPFVNDIVDRIHKNVSITKDDKHVGIAIDNVDESKDKKIAASGEEKKNINDVFVDDKSEIKDDKNVLSGDKGVDSNINDKELDGEVKVDSTSDEDKLREIADDLLNRIRGSFDECIFELEVLEGDVYLLSDEESIALTVKKIKEIKKKINDCVVKINSLIDIYNSYKKSNYLDSVADIDDDVIVDDLISFRTLLDGKANEKKFVGEIKNLDSFKELYLKLKDVRSDIEVLRSRANNKEADFELRDKKYKEILKGAINIAEVNKSCSEEIGKQNRYFEELMSKVNRIDRHEYVTTHLRGFGDLVGMSLRYIGLLMFNPFRNTLPGIGVQTLLARRMIGNLYHNLHYEEVNHVYYDAIDYDNEIASNLSSVHFTSSMLSDALSDIDRLLGDFMLQYDSNIPGYDSTLKNINSIRNIVVSNQRRMNIIEKRLMHGKRLNEDKLVLVRQMNEHE